MLSVSLAQDFSTIRSLCVPLSGRTRLFPRRQNRLAWQWTRTSTASETMAGVWSIINFGWYCMSWRMLTSMPVLGPYRMSRLLMTACRWLPAALWATRRTLFFMLPVSWSSWLWLEPFLWPISLTSQPCDRANKRVADIRLGCTNFPQGRRPSFSGTVPIRGGSVELMEVYANTTLIDGSESPNASVYGGQSIGNESTRTNVDLTNIVTPAPWPT